MGRRSAQLQPPPPEEVPRGMLWNAVFVPFALLRAPDLRLKLPMSQQPDKVRQAPALCHLPTRLPGAPPHPPLTRRAD